MIPFHRPKVYRSPAGCCICGAKSSSSRFTDSKKYEDVFPKCFVLTTPRQGEICNACVLLVKRYKKLPEDSVRNWKHVVDARAGPGMKSMSRFKRRNRMKLNDALKLEVSKAKEEFEREDSPELSDKSDGNEDGDIAEVDSLSEESGSSSSSSPRSDSEDSNDPMKGRRSKSRPTKVIRRNRPEDNLTDYIDEQYWTREQTCCGLIFRGTNGEVMIDISSWAPCKARVAKRNARCFDMPKSEIHSNINITKKYKKLYSDTSSDSGYDECSNQGILADSAFKKDSLLHIEQKIPIFYQPN